MVAPSRLLDHRGLPMNPYRGQETESRRRQVWDRILARFDAAQTTPENANHWAAADGLSAKAAASPEIRKKIRERSRYETENNSYLKGMVLTIANATIGTGPRLQLKTDDPDVNAFIEREFHDWCDEIRIADKLRTAEMSTIVDGESFVMRSANWRQATPVKADLLVIEADQIATPHLDLNPDAVDGLVFGSDNYVDGYHLLERHPGDLYGWSLKSRIISQRHMVHLFREDRPGQRRGISETQPSLHLFAMLRRFVLAVLAAAETAADYAAIMYTDSNALEADDIPNLDPNDAMPIDRRVFQIMPNGWKMSQLRAEQPTTTFSDFRAAIINEAARCFLMPFNIATGNSSGYNFASGRLDYHIWEQAVRIRQYARQRTICRQAFLWWFREAVKIAGYLPAGIREQDLLHHTWLWPAVTGPIDQLKDAKADETRLATKLASREEILAARGVDVDELDVQLAREDGFSSVTEWRRAEFARKLNELRSMAQGMQPADSSDDSIDATFFRYFSRAQVV